MVLAVVNAEMMGGDIDTTGAVIGAIAGARFGAEAVPERWLTDEVDDDEEVCQLTTKRVEL